MLIKISSILLISICGILAYYYFQQSQFIYHPSKSKIDPQNFDAPQAEVITLPTRDGLNLFSWYFPAKNNMPTLLYLHGNRGHIGKRVRVIQSYLEAGYGVLLLEYRGYSTNPGKPSEEGFIMMVGLH